MNREAALTVAGIAYAFGTRSVLDSVGFEVSPGRCSMLLGPNGAGKTTLFSLITRLYDAPTGTIRIAGFDIRTHTRSALARLGVVFQQPTLDLDLNVEQNLRYHGSLHGIPRKQVDRRIQVELERQSMWERRHEKVRHLNGGHRRRVEIARALIHEPMLLLLDEPTVGLDVPSRQGIVSYLHELCAEKDIAILWATHLIDEILADDHLIILHKGRVRACGQVEQVLAGSGTDSVNDAFRALTTDGEGARA